MRRIRIVGPVTAYGVAPAASAGTTSTGSIDGTGFDVLGIGTTFTLLGQVFRFNLIGIPAPGPGEIGVDLNGTSPGTAMAAAIDGAGIGCTTTHGVFAVNITGPKSAASNRAITSTYNVLVLSGMSGGVDPSAGGVSVWPDRV
jgi:hypothetical protein